jgi:DNA-binding NtrC family response regulator
VKDQLLSGRRVLVVEDEMLILMMTESMLADLGCESVTAAVSVNQALALIDEQIFDIAMLDMNLDGNKSHAVADALAAHSVPFVFATGGSEHETSVEHRDRPMLKKPFQFEKMVEILTRLLTN